MAMGRRGSLSRAWWIAGGGIVAWFAGVLWAVPLVIRLAYQERAFSFLNALIGGRDVHPVEYYLDLWGGAALRLTALLVALGIVAAAAHRYRTPLVAFLRSSLGAVRPLRIREVLLLAVFFGALGGLAEATQQIVAHWVFLRVTDLWVSSEIFWMAPLAGSLVMLLVAAPVLAARRLGAIGDSFDGVVPFLFSGLAVFGLGRAAQVGIHPLALLVLALGVGAQATRTVGRRTDASLRWAGRATAVLAAGLLLWGLLLPGWPERPAQESGTDGPPEAERTPSAVADTDAPWGARPNILVVLWDTVRPQSLSLYGYHRPTTPNLERLASTGTVFEAAVSTAPWTLPAHASLFTGRYHHELSVGRQHPLDDAHPTLAEALRDQGYRTGGFVANTYWLGRAWGLARGFEHYEDRPHLSAEAIVLSTWLSSALYLGAARTVGLPVRGMRISAEQVGRSFVGWVDRDDARPFFAFLNLYDAHEPYLPPRGFGFPFSDAAPRYTWDYRQPVVHSSQDLAELREAYDACVLYLDRQLGLLLDELEARGLLDRTLVVVTSDHGETLGEHGPDLLGHENNVFYDVLQVPLVFRLPGRVASGLRRPETVSLADVPATLLELAGVRSEERPLPGTALLQAGEPNSVGRPEPRPALSQANPATYHLPEYTTWPISKGPLFSLVDGSAHYIVNADGDEQLFDLGADPWEHLNLSLTPEGSRRAGELRDLLVTLVGGPGERRYRP